MIKTKRKGLNEKGKIIIGIIIFLILIINVNAELVNVSTDKKVCQPGEKVSVQVFVENKNPSDQNFILKMQVSSNNLDSPIPLATYEYFNLSYNEKKSIQFNIDTNLFLDGIYFINLQLFNDTQDIIDEKIETFSIVNSQKLFDFFVNICKDSLCQQKSQIFVLRDNIYLNYESSVSNPTISAILTYPDSKSIDINLPYEFKASQIGTYTLDVTASKEGYKTMSTKELFGIIEKPAEVVSIKPQPISDYVYVESLKTNENKNDVNNEANIKEVSNKSESNVKNYGKLIFWFFIAGIVILVIIIIYKFRKVFN